MAEKKKRESVAEITGYEAALVKALEAAVRIGLTSDNLYDNISVYNDLYEAGYNFIEKMVLCKYRTKLDGRKIDPAEVANILATELFWKKLDYIMSSKDPVGCRGLINETAKWRVYDFIRSDKRAQNDVDIQEDDIESELKEDAHNDLQNDKHYNTANVHFTTEVGWNLVASDVNLEEDAITYDSCMEVLDALKENRNGFEVISFLGTKVVGYKASECRSVPANAAQSAAAAAKEKQKARQNESCIFGNPFFGRGNQSGNVFIFKLIRRNKHDCFDDVPRFAFKNRLFCCFFKELTPCLSRQARNVLTRIFHQSDPAHQQR